MTDRALVIGLDYDNAKWQLRAAVRDALAFADWVTAPGAGRATAATLTLLLAPHPDRPVVGRTFTLATETAIRRALYDHKKLSAADTGRLWFFYAGHGLAPAGGGPDEAPVVVPADVADLDFYRSNPVDVGSWIREMQVCAPEQQVYFVDACRGIVVSEDVVTATRTLFFDLSKVPPGAQARQAVLFATTAGQLANEQGLHGLFSEALIDGLKGTGPELRSDPATQEFALTFGALSAYTKQRIQARAEEVRRQHRTLPTQDPAESLFRTDGSLELARFAKKPRSKVRVFVKPDEATAKGTAGIRVYDDFADAWERRGEKASPLGVPIEWELPSTPLKIEIESEGYENWSKKVHVIAPLELRAELVEKLKPPVDDAFESVAPREVSPPPPDGAELAPGKVGTVQVRALDRYARVEVFDQGGRRAAAGWGGLDQKLPVGAYRIEVSLPTERPVVQSVLLTADEVEVIEVQPDPQLTARLPPSAGAVQPHDGLTHPSEQFGAATTTHLGSLLAWAATAAQYPAYGDGQKLRSLGVEPLPPDNQMCFLRVLVGDARAPVPNVQGGPIETLVLHAAGQPIPIKPVPGLAGFAVQASAPWQPDLMVATDGLTPKRFPCPFVPGHVWTIVIVRESTQRTEIHRYLQPLQPQQPFDDTIRLVEQSWRGLESRTPLYEDEVKRLLARNLDALSLAVLGYRLAREERFAELAPLVPAIRAAGLADAHVLAALVADRDTNMERALGGLPVVGDGYRLMEEWTVAHFAAKNLPPPIAPEPFTGGLWTSFDARGQAVISKAFPVYQAPAWAKPLLPAAEATARIEPAPGNPIPFFGTGFLIGPRALVTADFIADANARYAVFGDKRAEIIQVVAASNDDRHGALARIEVLAPPPPSLKIRWALPEVGTRIAVIGHPQITFIPTAVTMAAFTTRPTGEKMIMPGVITEVEDEKLTYECWTMAGVGGGPILDLATGEVIGIHHSGRYEGGAKKIGWGTPVVALEALLKTPI